MEIPKLRTAQTEQEKEIIKKCYMTGLKNGWASGKFARMDGDFIDPSDCLNKDSIGIVDTEQQLKEFFAFGNWCLGQGVIYKDMFFLQQDNGGDEWASYKIFSDKVEAWDSISWGRIIDSNEWDSYFKQFSEAKTKKEYWTID